MASTTQSSNQVLEAMVWYYGKRECRSVTFVDDVALSLEDEYFDLNLIDESYAEAQFYVWLNGGTGTDPAIAGKTGIEITYTSGDTKETLAGLLVAALASNDVKASDEGSGLVQLENRFLGVITAESYTNAPSLTATSLQVGTGGSLGAIAQGGATITTEQSLEDIFRDDEGDVIQDQILKGAGVSGELQAAEMTTANWDSLVGNAFGDKHTEGVDDLYGYGTSKLYQSSFSYAGQLVGHPKRLANSDRSADICIWKTVSNMSDINYSGSEVQVGSFSFQALPDSSKPVAINLFARGDHSLL
jgi:hypothetical protein